MSASSPTEPDRVAEAPERRGRGLLVAGYVTALVLPVVGVVLGVLILIRRRSLHGAAVIVLSIAVGIALLALPRGDNGGKLSPRVEREMRKSLRCFQRHLATPADVDKLLRVCDDPGKRKPGAGMPGAAE